MTKSLTDTDYSISNGEYNIDPQTGYLVGPETLAIQISGQKPTGGSLKLEKNEIKQGCLVIGEYEVSFVNGNISETKKGNCMSAMEEMCPGCVFTTNNIDEDKYIGIDTITNYETDYKNIDSTTFLGYILNEDTNVIEKAFVCSSKDGIPFCIEGSSDTAIIEKNIRNINGIIKFDDYNNFLEHGFYFWRINTDGSYGVSLYTNGNVEVTNDDSLCVVQVTDGRTGCYSS